MLARVLFHALMHGISTVNDNIHALCLPIIPAVLFSNKRKCEEIDNFDG